jgi:hypothetical protein
MTVTREAGTLYVDAPLSNMAIDYVSDMFPLAKGEAFPKLIVPRKTGVYYVFDKNFRTASDSRWTPGTQVKSTNSYIASTSSFACERHKLTDSITSEDMAYADKIIKPKVRKTKRKKDQIMRELEVALATALQDSAGTYASYTTAVSNAWTSDNSTPKADVNGAKEAIWSATGVDPEQLILIIGYEKFNDLKTNAEVRDQFKYTSPQSITQDMMKEFFGVKRLIVHKGLQDTTVEGQTASPSVIWTATNATLLYAPDSPAIDDPSAGYIASERLFGGGDVRVRSFEDLDRTTEQSIIEVTMSWQVLETSNESVHILTSV